MNDELLSQSWGLHFIDQCRGRNCLYLERNFSLGANTLRQISLNKISPYVSHANTIISKSVEETIQAGYEFGMQLKPGDVVCLDGDLGAGKTHFVKGVASYFGIEPEKVSSPTYTLIHEYSGDIPVYHFDCYRLKHEEEALEIGAEEYLYGEGVCLIEWPEKIGSLIPEDAIQVKINHRSDSERELIIHKKNPE